MQIREYTKADLPSLQGLMTSKAPDLDAYKSLADKVYTIGDCQEMGSIRTAVRAAYDLACNI